MMQKCHVYGVIAQGILGYCACEWCNNVMVYGTVTLLHVFHKKYFKERTLLIVCFV